MRTIAALFFLTLSVSAYAADAVTPQEAKRLAENAMRVMNQVGPVALDPASDKLDSATRIRTIEAPLNNVADGWPGPYFLEENKALEPYYVCVEAVQALNYLHTVRTSSLPRSEVTKVTTEYTGKWRRCEESIKTGRYTERSAAK